MSGQKAIGVIVYVYGINCSSSDYLALTKASTSSTDRAGAADNALHDL